MACCALLRCYSLFDLTNRLCCGAAHECKRSSLQQAILKRGGDTVLLRGLPGSRQGSQSVLRAGDESPRSRGPATFAGRAAALGSISGRHLHRRESSIRKRNRRPDDLQRLHGSVHSAADKRVADHLFVDVEEVRSHVRKVDISDEWPSWVASRFGTAQISLQEK